MRPDILPRAERVARELRSAVRGFWRTPGFTITALLVLGIGIGTATAMFTVFDAVLLRPLPVRDATHLVLPQTLDASGTDIGMSQQDIQVMLSASHTLRAAAGVAHQGAFSNTLLDNERPVVLQGAWVTGNFFEVLGTRPALGRFFTSREESSAALPDVLVLSYDTWQRRFGGDSGVIGRRLGTPYSHQRSTIIGVAPPGLAYPRGAEYWTPLVYPTLDVVARSSTGAATPAVRADFLAVMRRIDSMRVQQHLQGAAIARVSVTAFRDGVLGDVRVQLAVLSAAVALLLLIAGVNIGNLGLLKSMARRREIGVRRSLGAQAGDIVRPILWENALLAAGGAMLGTAVAVVLLRLIVTIGPARLPRLDTIHFSFRTVVAGTAITGVALLLAALPVVIFATHASFDEIRGLAGGRITGSPAQNRSRRVMVIAQVALALMLVVSAGLLLRSLDRLTHVPLGFRPDHLSIVTLAMPVEPGSDPMPQFIDLYHRVEPAVRGVPGVVATTPVATSPFYGPQVFAGRWAARGQSDNEATANPMVPFEVGGSEYFRTFGIPIVRGRGFLESDDANAPPVVVVSQALAERFWPGQDPIGKMMRLVGDTGARIWHQVVGEAGDIRYRTLRAATPTIFVPWQQLFFQGVFAVRTTSGLAAMLPELRKAVRGAAPDAMITESDEMDALIDRQLALPSFSAWLLAGFGAGALLLAVLGLYGVMAASVRERTRELGIRAALGATPERLRSDVMRRALAMTSVGAVIGIAGALVATRFIRAALFEVGPADSLTISGAAGLLMLVSVGAAYLPAWRATQSDPASALSER